MTKRERHSVSRLRWAGVCSFMAGVATLIAGAIFKASGPVLFYVLWASVVFVSLACALYLIDVVSQWVTRRKNEREHIAGNAG